MEERVMSDQKVPKTINDFISDNVQALASLFPAAVKDGQVDFTALKEELGQFEEVDKEKYELTWAGKQEAKKKAQEDVFGRTLKYIHEDSKNPETTENLYIEGDNLEVLKLLRQNYYGSIKMIYIDPPYNTGNDFVYNDNFKMDAKESDIAEGTLDEYGERMQKNQKSTNRFHANWLNMMYPRLKVAKDLLTDEGIIFISINDNELQSLKKICTEIFGERNEIATLIWDKNHSAQAGIYKVYHEYVLVYSRNSDYISRSKSLNNDLFEAGAMKKVSGRHPATSFTFPAGTRFDAQDGTEFIREYGGAEKVRIIKGRMIAKDYKLLEAVTLEAGFTQANQMRQFFYGDRSALVDSQGQKIVEFYFSSTGKIKIVKERSVETPQTTCKFGTQGSASNELSSLFELEECPFSSPKPLKMLTDFIQRFTDDGDIILDFFSGSATTAHAVMEVNSLSGMENRKFIQIQLQEDLDESLRHAQKDAVRTLQVAIEYLDKNKLPHTIPEIGKERIRRAGDKIKCEVEEHNAQLKIGEEPKQVPDIGFKVFTTADTNIKWNLIESEGQMDTEAMTHTPDLADFTFGFNDIDVVYEIMLRQKDIPLSEKLEVLSDIGTRTYLYGSAYLICLETNITEELIGQLASLNPLPIKFVFRDTAFKDDIDLKDDTFRLLKNLIDRNSGTNKNTYTVEFI
jgi:adenine-specific DNA-methyltransferase